MAGSRPSSSNTCAICERSFSRIEHLKRHMIIHRGERPFGCKHCTKTFSRKDAAHRHEQNHLSRSAASDIVEAPNRRSCSSCAQARVRCSGHAPCEFCLAKSLDCVYRPRKRRRQQPSSSGGQRPETSPTVIPTSEIPREAGGDGNYEITLPPLASHGPGFDHISDRSQVVDSAVPTSLVITDTSNDAQMWSALNSTELQAMQHNHPQSASVNWLPFGASHFDHTPFSPQMQGVTEDRHQGAGTSQATHLVDADNPSVSFQPPQQLTGTPVLQSDRVSALITSMLMNSASIDSDSPSDHSVRSRVGRLYADGHGARVSQSDRRSNRRASTVDTGDLTQPSSSPTWLSILRGQAMVRTSQGHAVSRISPEVHTELMLKIADRVELSAYSSRNVSSNREIVAITTWDYLIALYFDHFHPIYPFLDQSLLGLPTWGWSLCLATAAVGARYTALPELAMYGEFLSKMLHHILVVELETGEIDDALPFLQARALCAINLCQSRQSDYINAGISTLTLVCNSSLRLRLLSEDPRVGGMQREQTSEQAWIAWRFREMRRRTGIFIITAVVNLALFQGDRPKLDLNSVSILLPSSENLWQAETCLQWYQCFAGDRQVVHDPGQFKAEEDSRSLLKDTVRTLWVSNKFPTPISPFATEAIIYMLIKRTWHADQYFKDQLWIKPKDGDSYDQLTAADFVVYPGSDPNFARWRNTTCDCLDTIHWDALSIAAKACGFESTVFLSLHLARLLLLTPVQDLLDFAVECAGHTSTCMLPRNIYASSASRSDCGHIVSKWWSQDRYKARLALIHAGAMFWHIRRYASDSYMQPFAVYLATVVLWAYGTCASRHSSQSATMMNEACLPGSDVLSGPSLETELSRQSIEGHTPSTRSEGAAGVDGNPQNDVRMPKHAQLDRPVDDELVQHFIRYGSLRICLEGVPDLCSVEGTLQVLREGSTVLQLSAGTWPISERYIASLQDIASTMHAV